MTGCPHDDPRCPHGPACRLERCSACAREYHVLGARGFRSSCCEALMVPAEPVIPHYDLGFMSLPPLTEQPLANADLDSPSTEENR